VVRGDSRKGDLGSTVDPLVPDGGEATVVQTMTRTPRIATWLALVAWLLSAALPASAAGNPKGSAPVPPEARAVDTSHPDQLVGNGTAASCTSRRVMKAVAHGGIIRFRCGHRPVVIRMQATARVFNDRPDVVLDGRGRVTLDGQGVRRILYMNTCDPDLVWTTPHCQNQDHPTLTVQNLVFRNGRSTGRETMDGGGAIFVRGGRLKVVNSTFVGNRCAATGPDVGGAAVQVFAQFEGLPVDVVSSTFGGPRARRNACSNGGAISSIGVSWTILNSLFQGNRAIGRGANPPKPGTPGGGNGGAIYNDGNSMTLRVAGTRIVGNHSNGEGGSAIFFVSNDRSGDVEVEDSVLRDNTGDGFSTYPGIFFLGRRITFTDSVVE
jgi:hypothetical protein